MISRIFIWLPCAALMQCVGAWAAELPSALTTASNSASAPSAGDAIGSEPAIIADSAEVLTLPETIDRAIASSPRLKSASAALAASRGDQLQAGLLPNPELMLEAENFAGRGPYSGLNSAELTIGASQLIELGGKRSSRQSAAAQTAVLREMDYEAARLDLIRDVKVAYVAAIAAHEARSLAKQQRELAADLLREVNSRVDAAREPLIQRSKAQITSATSDLAYERAERERTEAMRALSTIWGGTRLSSALDTTEFFMLAEPAAISSVELALQKNPSLMRWEAERARSEAAFRLEQSQAVPDPRVSVGVREFRDRGDKALVAGISIPIPVFNRNQGSIERARREISKTDSDSQVAVIALQNTAFTSLRDQMNAYKQATSLKETILPAAEKAFELARDGYRAGKFPYLEVLDSQRTLFDARVQYIAALKDYHRASAELERAAPTHKQSTQEPTDAN